MPANPPPTPAGYSGTPLPRKLGMRAGQRMLILNAPSELPQELGSLQEEMGWDTELPSEPRRVDFILFFTREAGELEAGFDAMAMALHPAGMLWVAWPKRASRVPTDVTEDVVRRIALAHGMVDVKVCAIDAVWSGLKLVFRLADRDGLVARG